MYRNCVCDDLQQGENYKRIHLSLGTGVFGGHLSTTFSRRSRTDIIAFAVWTTVECRLSSTAVPTSSSIYSFAQAQN